MVQTVCSGLSDEAQHLAVDFLQAIGEVGADAVECSFISAMFRFLLLMTMLFWILRGCVKTSLVRSCLQGIFPFILIRLHRAQPLKKKSREC